jgi:metal-sulfur cluster biosynthetic enzyme
MKEKIIEALKNVIDPELNLDVWTLGLIYEVHVKSDSPVKVLMTLTSPTCPFGPQLVAEIKREIENVGFSTPNIEFTFDPPWEPNDEVKELLGLA